MPSAWQVEAPLPSHAGKGRHIIEGATQRQNDRQVSRLREPAAPSTERASPEQPLTRVGDRHGSAHACDQPARWCAPRLPRSRVRAALRERPVRDVLPGPIETRVLTPRSSWPVITRRYERFSGVPTKAPVPVGANVIFAVCASDAYRRLFHGPTTVYNRTHTRRRVVRERCVEPRRGPGQRLCPSNPCLDVDRQRDTATEVLSSSATVGNSVYEGTSAMSFVTSTQRPSPMLGGAPGSGPSCSTNSRMRLRFTAKTVSESMCSEVESKMCVVNVR